MISLLRSVAGVLGPDGKPMGTAFFVSSQVLVTCTHVLRNMGVCGPLDGIRVNLQLVRLPVRNGQPVADKTTLWARVTEWREADAEDITVLELLDAPNDPIVPLPLNAYSHPAAVADSYGFPARAQENHGRPAVAAVNSMGLHNGRYAVLWSGADAITWGFSGAPLVDRETHKVIGIVVCIFLPDEANRFQNSGYGIPIEALWSIRPDLYRGPVVCPYDVTRVETKLVGVAVRRPEVREAIAAKAQKVGLWFQPGELPETLANEIAELRPARNNNAEYADGSALLIAEIVGWCLFNSRSILMLTRPEGSIDDMIASWAEAQFHRVVSRDNDELATRIIAAHTQDATRYFIAAAWRTRTMDSERIDKIEKELLEARILIKGPKGLTIIAPTLGTDWPRIKLVLTHWQTKLKWIGAAVTIVLVFVIAAVFIGLNQKLKVQKEALNNTVTELNHTVTELKSTQGHLETKNETLEKQRRFTEAQILFEAGQSTWAADLLVRNNEPPPDRQLAWVDLATRILHAGRVRHLVHDEPTVAVALSEKGAFVATMGKSGRASVWRGFGETTADQKNKPIFTDTDVSFVRFAPKDNRLWIGKATTSGHAGSIYVYKLDEKTTSKPEAQIVGPAGIVMKDALFGETQRLTIAVAQENIESKPGLYRIDFASDAPEKANDREVLPLCHVQARHKRPRSNPIFASAIDVSDAGILAICDDMHVRYEDALGNRTEMGPLFPPPSANDRDGASFSFDFVRLLSDTRAIVATSAGIYEWDLKARTSARKIADKANTYEHAYQMAGPFGKVPAIFVTRDNALAALSNAAKPTDYKFPVEIVGMDHSLAGLILLGRDGSLWKLSNPARLEHAHIQSLFKPLAHDPVNGSGVIGAAGAVQLAMSSDRTAFATGAEDPIVRVWRVEGNLDAGKIVDDTADESRGPQRRSVAIISSVAGNATLVTGPEKLGRKGQLRMWSVTSNDGHGFYQVKPQDEVVTTKQLLSLSLGGAAWKDEQESVNWLGWDAKGAKASITATKPVVMAQTSRIYAAVHPQGICAIWINATGDITCSASGESNGNLCPDAHGSADLREPRFAWSRDGTRLFIAKKDGLAKVFSVGKQCQMTEEKWAISLPDTSDAMEMIAVDPKGERIAVVTQRHEVWVYNRNDPNAPPLAIGHRLNATSAAFSADGRLLAITSSPTSPIDAVVLEGMVTLWDLDQRRFPVVTLKTDCHLGSVDVSGNANACPDCSIWVAAGCDDGTARAWDLSWTTLRAKLHATAAVSPLSDEEHARQFGGKP